MKLTTLLYASAYAMGESLASISDGSEITWRKPREFEIISKYESGEEIILTNPSANGTISRAKADVFWHQCGESPDKPANARDVVCQGSYCATVCEPGYISTNKNRIRCRRHGRKFEFVGKLSACVTCPDFNESKLSPLIQRQTDYVKNLRRETFFCPNSQHQVELAGKEIGKRVNIRCHCKKLRGQKNCNWTRGKKKSFKPGDFLKLDCHP